MFVFTVERWSAGAMEKRCNGAGATSLRGSERHDGFRRCDTGKPEWVTTNALHARATNQSKDFRGRSGP